MNYAYPLNYSDFDNEDILKVCDETACSVVYNIEEDAYYLVLCGGGMDLSQDIALAYIILTGTMPFELARQVSKQHGLSKSGDNWVKIMEEAKDVLNSEIALAGSEIKRINEALEAHKEVSE